MCEAKINLKNLSLKVNYKKNVYCYLLYSFIKTIYLCILN